MRRREFVRETLRGVNVATVPHRSPFRYPGGKTWLVPHIRQWLSTLPQRPSRFCEPFCGGAIVGLSVLFEGYVDELVLVELDEDVASVWLTILNGGASDLADRILSFRVAKPSVKRVLEAKPVTLQDRAFATLLKNRVNRGGILAPGASLMKLGENGRGLASRWYPRTLRSRILAIGSKKDSITFRYGDGIKCMRELSSDREMVFFIDPPYTVAGRRLYTHSEIGHEGLFSVAATLKGDFLMTYDDAEPIRDLARRHGFDMHTVIMKNTHHRVMGELLIGRNLDWARSELRKFRQNFLFELS